MLRIVEERDYPVTLLCGGARIPFDLTGLVGAGLHATINWSTFAEVMAGPEPFARGIDEPIDPGVIIDGSMRRFDDVRRALLLDGLPVDEFEDFGPVQHFRDTSSPAGTRSSQQSRTRGRRTGTSDPSCAPRRRFPHVHETVWQRRCLYSHDDPHGLVAATVADHQRQVRLTGLGCAAAGERQGAPGTHGKSRSSAFRGPVLATQDDAQRPAYARCRSANPE